MTQARLLTPEQLAARLDDPNLVLLDCRFALETRPTAHAATRRIIFPARISPISTATSPPRCGRV